jgi:hypothetical protein
VVGSDTVYSIHNAMPTEVKGGVRKISKTAASMGDMKDEDMNAPQSIHTGAVLGVPHLKLIPEGGPQCSAMLTSEEPSIYLGGETEFILTMQSEPK